MLKGCVSLFADVNKFKMPTNLCLLSFVDDKMFSADVNKVFCDNVLTMSSIVSEK